MTFWGCCDSLSLLCVTVSMVHEAALPKPKQHGMKATKARREHPKGTAALKTADDGTAHGAPYTTA